MPHIANLKTTPFLGLTLTTCLLCGCANAIHPRYGQTTGREPATTANLSHPAALDATPYKSGQHWLQTGRYHTVNAVPTREQQALLQIIIEVTLPEEVADIQSGPPH